MKIIGSITGIVVLLGVVLAMRLAGLFGTVPVISGVSVENITDTSATITWTTDKPASGRVVYRIPAESNQGSREENQSGVAHHVDINGLRPDTYYRFHVASTRGLDSATSTDMTFTTLAQVQTYKIAFDSFRDGHGQVCIINADGTGEVQLTGGAYDSSCPSWSPGSKKIVFASNRTGKNQVYTMNADGNGQTRLTDNQYSDFTPAWLPGGDKIAFVSDRDGSNQIYTMNTDGSGQARLTSSKTDKQMPVWSPDGKKVLFVSPVGDNNQIYIMDADGSHESRLISDTYIDSFPSWSVDGRQIVFSSRRGGSSQIYAVNADGSGLRQLTNRDNCVGPRFSPDGKQIAFSYISGTMKLYAMDADGANPAQLTSGTAQDFNPRWSPVPMLTARIPTLQPGSISRGTGEQNDTQPSQYAIYKSSVYGYSIKYPLGWPMDTIDDSSIMMGNKWTNGMLLVSVSKADLHQWVDSFVGALTSGNVNVRLAANEQGTGIWDWYASYEEISPEHGNIELTTELYFKVKGEYIYTVVISVPKEKLVSIIDVPWSFKLVGQ